MPDSARKLTARRRKLRFSMTMNADVRDHLDQPLGQPSVDLEVVRAAEQVVVDPGRIRLADVHVRRHPTEVLGGHCPNSSLLARMIGNPSCTMRMATWRPLTEMADG